MKLKKVVSAMIGWQWGSKTSWELTLECGHMAWRTTTTGKAPNLAKCWECIDAKKEAPSCE